MTLVTHLQKWWALRSDDQRAKLKQAANSDDLDTSTVQLLLNTKCPIGPVGTKWESQPEYAWSWPSSVRTFIATADEEEVT
jgi:hypothetical protein